MAPSERQLKEIEDRLDKVDTEPESWSMVVFYDVPFLLSEVRNLIKENAQLRRERNPMLNYISSIETGKA